MPTTWAYTSPRIGTSTESTIYTVSYAGQYLTQSVYVGATDFIFNGTINNTSFDLIGGVLTANGTNYNLGQIGFAPAVHYAYGIISIGQNLINYGTILMNTYSGEIQAQNSSSTLTNYGTIDLDSVRVDTAVSGTGKIVLEGPHEFLSGPPIYSADVEFDRGVSAGQTIDMSTAGTLLLKDLTDFHATLLDFSGSHLAVPSIPARGYVQSSIELLGLKIASLRSSVTATQAVLSIQATNGVHGSITLNGNYLGHVFSTTPSGGNSFIGVS